MKLLKKDRKQLEAVLQNLQRVQRYILSDQVAFVKTKSMATTTTDLTDQQGHTFTGPMEKQNGTELCYLYSATNQLHRLLHEPTHTEANNISPC